MNEYRNALALLTGMLLAAGCSGPSSYNTTAHPPTAVARVVGFKPTSASGVDPVAVTVRSSSQVTLTGNASDGGAAAIGNFVWTQTDSSATPTVKLLYLDAATVTFTAPPVASDTTLNFELKVTTAGNAAATAHVAVTVKPASDSNRFLLQPKGSVHTYKVAVASVEGIGPLASPAATLADDVPICVSENRAIVYKKRNGAQNTVKLAPIQADTAWITTVGGAPQDFNSYSNPRVSFDIPALNQDDLAYLYRNPVAGETDQAAADRVALQLLPSDVDSASLTITATVSQGPCSAGTNTAGVGGKTLKVEILDENGNPVGNPVTAGNAGVAVTSATFTPDTLVSQTASAYETADTARAYYDAIDPMQMKKTLNTWLDVNCFDHTKTNYGADAHAVYVNNYDLGFGRDMYFVACKSGPHTGDMASVVINYASLEATASKLNPIIAVAMEYSAAADATGAGANRNQRRFAKFYVFAPDDRTGEMTRVSSANFDHRGEKYVPGSCAACHGGTLPQFLANFAHTAGATDTSYATVPDPTHSGAQLGLGDVDAVFMPWDMDSFLYSDTDPAFVGDSVKASDFSRATQTPNIKVLNQLVYCTYQPALLTPAAGGGAAIDRFAASRKLVAQWYGGLAPDGTAAVDTSCAATGVPTASLLPGTYSDGYTPPGWAGKTAPGAAATTQTSDFIYHNVFARNCRSCHTQDTNPLYQFSDYVSYINAFKSVPAGVGTPASSGLGVQYVFKQAKMPLARLTTDRFWVNYEGGDSAAKILATHIQEAVSTVTDLVDPSSHDAVPPGAAQMFVTASGPNAGTKVFTPDTSNSAQIGRYGGVSVDASTSFFAAQYSWSLCLIAQGTVNCAATPLIGSSVATPAFANNRAGEYDLEVIAKNDAGASTPTTFKFTVQPTPPSVDANNPNCNTLKGLATTSTAFVYTPLNFTTCVTPGDEPPGTPNMFQLLDPSSGTYKSTVTTASWTASTSATCTPTAPFNCTYSVTAGFNNQTTADPGTGIVATLSYRVTDEDGLFAPGTIDLLLIDVLTASGATIDLGHASGASYPFDVSLLNFVVVPAGDASVNAVVPANFTALPAGMTAPPAGTQQFPKGGNISATPVSTVPNSIMTYTTPQNFYTCDFNGDDLATAASPCDGDSFYYYLISGTNATSQLAKVVVKVEANSSYSRTAKTGNPVPSNVIFPILTTNCTSGCHVATTPAPTSADSASANYHWAVYSGDPASTYQSFRGADSTYNLDQEDWTQVDYTETAQTDKTKVALYGNPCGSGTGHNPSHPAVGISTQDCQRLLLWLNEGAAND